MFWDNTVAFAHILPLGPDVSALLFGLKDFDRIGFRFGVLNLEHGVRALGDGGAGHDPDCLACSDSLAREPPGGHIFNDLQDSRRRHGVVLLDVLIANGKAIHGRVIPGGIIAIGDNVLGQHATESIEQIDLFNPQDRHRVQDDLESIF